MITRVVARSDTVYKAVPDLTRAADGTLVCVYRESLFHLYHPFSRIVLHRSRDGGRNWDTGTTLHELAEYERDGGLNTPRLRALANGDLLLICDWHPPLLSEYSPGSEIWLWRSRDAGASWDGPVCTAIRRHICPSLYQLADGTLLMGGDAWDGSAWSHNLYRSRDHGVTWQGPTAVAASSRLAVTEGSYVELADGTLVCYLREDAEQLRAYKALSRDGGVTWDGPWPTDLLNCSGRPHAGTLRSGEVVITHGFGKSPRQLALHVESPRHAADRDAARHARHGHHVMAAPYRRLFIDMDRSIHPDGAYSSWVQLDGGDLFIVQYIVDDAPMAHIRSYRVSRDDWILCPEGELPRIDKVDPPASEMHRYDRSRNVIYHDAALAVSARRFRKEQP